MANASLDQSIMTKRLHLSESKCLVNDKVTSVFICNIFVIFWSYNSFLSLCMFLFIFVHVGQFAALGVIC